MAEALDGRRIAVPESRELDLFAEMLERHGAITVRCPLVAIHDVDDAGPVVAWLERLAGGRHNDVILFTGEGVTRLLGFAERAGLHDAVVDGLRAARKIVRGPKPTRALRLAGLAPDINAEAPTTDGIIATLSTLDLTGHRVGVQLYPDNPNDKLMTFLSKAGAEADPVQCYRYASQEEDGAVIALIKAMAGGEIDLIAFTSTPQIRRLQEVAGRNGLDVDFAEALRRTAIAAIGPVTAEAVEKAGGKVSIAPGERFHLKPFVGEIAGLVAQMRGCSG